jgi:26S proteasome regulatory subunit N5
LRFGRHRPNHLRRKKWNLLNEYISILVKKRSQFKQANVKMVLECSFETYLTPDKEKKIKFIETLRSAPEGKIYVEIERPCLTKILAVIR